MWRFKKERDETSWICDRCNSTKVYWNEEIDELVCESCGKVFNKEMPRLAAISKDHISERGTCEACGLENAHLVLKCRKCGRKICLEYCYEMVVDGLCIFCLPEWVPDK